MFCSPQKLFLVTCLTATALAIPSPSDDSTSPYSAKYSSALLETSRASSSSSSSSSFYPASSPLDRTIDLSTLGIDLGSIFNSLLSPAGIVQQFVLTITLGKYPIEGGGPFLKTHIVFPPVVFRTVGWVLASIGYNSIIGSLPAGPITDLVRTLDLVLTPQVCVKTPSTSLKPVESPQNTLPQIRQLHKPWPETLFGQFGTWLPGL